MPSPAPLQVSTPTDTTIVITRSFNAPRRLVWEAFTNPEKMRLWMFAPPGWTMTTSEFEARQGGRYKWAWKTADADPMMVIHGTLTEFVPFERIVHTQAMEMTHCGPCGDSTVMLELTERNSVTHAKMTLSYKTREERDAALASGMEHGMEAGYRNLDAMLASASTEVR